jgi:hypothetical protein
MVDFIILHEKAGGKKIRQAVDNIDSYCDEDDGGRICLKCVDRGALASYLTVETPEQIDHLICSAQGNFLPVIADKWSVDIVAEFIEALKVNRDGIRDKIKNICKE